MVIEYRTEPEYREYLDGIPYPKVSPRRRHAVVQCSFAALLRLQGLNYGETGTEWDVWLPDREKWTKFIPDVSFFSVERLQTLKEADREFPPFAPDIVVEVRSPGDSFVYLRKKIDLYLSHGALVVFDVDPLAREILVYRASTDVLRLREGDGFADERIPWLAFVATEIFADLDDDKRKNKRAP